MVKMDYIDRLTEIRNDRDIKQSTIAEILGVKQSAVSKYEKRRTQYTVDDIIKLCNFYKISADYILGLPENLEFPKRD
ncbi:MAG: helix-turn-helix domain-containing protein [Eubacterium sp.]|nr:helix-turn-helix domain-containing protein [Eubacterium sp.]